MADGPGGREGTSHPRAQRGEHTAVSRDQSLLLQQRKADLMSVSQKSVVGQSRPAGQTNVQPNAPNRERVDVRAAERG